MAVEVEAAGEPAALGHVQLHASQTVPNSVGGDGHRAAGRPAGVRMWRNCLAWSPIRRARHCDLLNGGNGDPAAGRTAGVISWRGSRSRRRSWRGTRTPSEATQLMSSGWLPRSARERR